MMMNLVQELQNNTKGFEFDSRKQHMESMSKLAKEGYKQMEIRATELSDKDLKYFMDQGLEAELVEAGEYTYYRLIWEREYSPTITKVATGYATGFSVLKGIGIVLFAPLILVYKMTK